MAPPETQNLAGQGEVREVEIDSSKSANTTENAWPSQARWAAKHPQERWAQACLRSALRRGLIERLPCEVCGAVEVDAHHANYNEPMAVKWLCRAHHKAEHKRLRCEGVS